MNQFNFNVMLDSVNLSSIRAYPEMMDMVKTFRGSKDPLNDIAAARVAGTYPDAWLNIMLGV